MFALLALPSPVLFGALARRHAARADLPRGAGHAAAAFRLGQALVGVVIGALVKLPTLARLAADWPSVLLVTVGTLVISLVAGRLLALHRDVSPVTGAFALIAGGASGIVALARELGADDRVVTVVQYLRVLLVLLAMPLVTDAGLPPAERRRQLTPARPAGCPDLVFVASRSAAGLLLQRVVRAPATALLGPMLVAVAISASGVLGRVAVPTALEQLGYALIGVRVGLRFTRASLRSIARLLPLATGLIVAVIVACALLGLLLSEVTGVDRLTAYLATTPGGLFAVLATAADSGSDVTYVLAVQVIRVFAMLLFAPLLAGAAPVGVPVEAELVALGVLHHDVARADAPGLEALDPARTQRDQPLALRLQRRHPLLALEAGRRADVEVLAVLGGLALRDLLEEEPRPVAVGVEQARSGRCAGRRGTPHASSACVPGVEARAAAAAGRSRAPPPRTPPAQPGRRSRTSPGSHVPCCRSPSDIVCHECCHCLVRRSARTRADPSPPRCGPSDRDRDVVLGVLGEGYADGRLTKEEYDERAGATAAAKTLGELPTLIADLVPLHARRGGDLGAGHARRARRPGGPALGSTQRREAVNGFAGRRGRSAGRSGRSPAWASRGRCSRRCSSPAAGAAGADEQGRDRRRGARAAGEEAAQGARASREQDD